MKYIWEAGDIEPGRVVLNAGLDEPWMLTYKDGIGGQTYGLVSLLDGMIGPTALTKERLAEQLTYSKMVPSSAAPGAVEAALRRRTHPIQGGGL